MKGRDPNHLSRPVRTGKSMGEFGPDYKKTHDLVLGDKSDKFTGEWNKWKVKKEIPGKKPKNLSRYKVGRRTSIKKHVYIFRRLFLRSRFAAATGW